MSKDQLLLNAARRIHHGLRDGSSFSHQPQDLARRVRDLENLVVALADLYGENHEAAR